MITANENDKNSDCEFEIDYDPETVEKELKSKEAMILLQRIAKLEQELRNAVERITKTNAELSLKYDNLGKVKGNIFYTGYKNGYLVFGEDTKKNKDILKEIKGSWNATLKGWIFPQSSLDDIIKVGITEESIV